MISYLLAFAMLIGICLSSCTSLAAPKLRPGDKIGEMLLTTGASKAIPLRAFCLPGKEINGVMTVNCNLPPLSRVSIGDTFGVPDEVLASLDWSAQAWELSVDNQPVDLGAFDIYHAVLPGTTSSPSRIREVFKEYTAWDMVLDNLRPGLHTIKGLVYTKAVSYQWDIEIHCVKR